MYKISLYRRRGYRMTKTAKQSVSQDEILKISNRRYLGSKQKLLEFIEKIVEEHTEGIKTVADIFAGTGVVADLFQSKGKKVIVNDILHSNLVSYNTWFGNEPVRYELIQTIIRELNDLDAKEDNYVSIQFGDRYFSMENARKIGAIREKIETYSLSEREKSFLLTSLIYAIDKVANTVGHYDAYRKTMDTFQPLHLKVPEYRKHKKNDIYNEDANELVRKIKADLVYIDTPYNSRQYGDSYHVLENIVDWKKPKVTGVARKMDRNHIKSDYSTKKAPAAFDDLIQHINAKYILVSYNNMAQKGDGRSNAKISNEEILASLEKRGRVQIFDTPFKVYTTGKTDIEDHRELLYLCTVQPTSKKKESLIPSAVNYTGGKYKLLPQILPYFPDNIHSFYDVFSGGASVAVNVKVEDKIIINDIEPHVIKLYQYFRETGFDDILSQVQAVIEKYGLSDSKTRGYAYYQANSAEGLKKVNQKGFEQLKADYNAGQFGDFSESAFFYTLLVYSFNNQIRFNRSGDYNIPVGKRDFNEKMVEKLQKFQNALSRENTVLSNIDFRELLDSITDTRDFVYLDPPYLISTASYNENGGWTVQDEQDLLDRLAQLDRRGVHFALSNVLRHKGQENTLLKEWAKNYHVHYLNYNYNNSNYHSTADKSETIEVLITNYE